MSQIQFFFNGLWCPSRSVMGPWRETYVTGTGTLIFCSEILNDWEFWGAQKTKYFSFSPKISEMLKKMGVIFSKNQFFLKILVFQCPLRKFLFMGPLYSLRDTIIHWKKIEFDWSKKVSIFAQSLISHYFRGPYVGCSWWAPARGCPHFSNFWKSPKNEASRAKKLKFNENKDFWKSCFLGPP